MEKYSFDFKVGIVKRYLTGEPISDVGVPSGYMYDWRNNDRVLRAAADGLGITYEAAVELRDRMVEERSRQNRRNMSMREYGFVRH